MKLNLKLRTAAIAFAMFGSVALFSCEEDGHVLLWANVTNDAVIKPNINQSANHGKNSI